ncbi:hypothetical protein [Salinisphaera sp.]|nr:hypothetical protein [Salinisphaera sp.]HET7313579.1 hypothetical protein [Salinisphaera sp.]
MLSKPEEFRRAAFCASIAIFGIRIDVNPFAGATLPMPINE